MNEGAAELLDLHCHILPKIDDGARSLDESLEMARFYVNDGVKVVVATPHCHRHIHSLRDQILPRVDQLNRSIEAAGIPLLVLPGSEIQVSDTTEFRREFEAGVLCHLADGRDFTLLEFSWERARFPIDSVALIDWVRGQGMIPIVAHPERYRYFADEPHLLNAIVDAGAWLQITVDSLLGNHGPLARKMGEQHLRQYHEAVLASDAHNLVRCSGTAAGYEWVETHVSTRRAVDLRLRGEQILAKLLQTKPTNGSAAR